MTGTPENAYTEDRDTVIKVYATGINAWAHGLYFLNRWMANIKGKDYNYVEQMLCRQNEVPVCQPYDYKINVAASDFSWCLEHQRSLRARTFYKNGNPWRGKIPEVVCCGIVFPDELEKIFPTDPANFTYLPPAYECWYVFKWAVRP